MDKTYSMDRLSELTGYPPRTIRFYIASGYLPPSAGRGRGAAYGPDHLARLQALRDMQARGLRLADALGRSPGPDEPGLVGTDLPIGAKASAPALSIASPAGTDLGVTTKPTALPAATRYAIRLADGCELVVDADFMDRRPDAVRALVGAAGTILAKGVS